MHPAHLDGGTSSEIEVVARPVARSCDGGPRGGQETLSNRAIARGRMQRGPNLAPRCTLFSSPSMTRRRQRRSAARAPRRLAGGQIRVDIAGAMPTSRSSVGMRCRNEACPRIGMESLKHRAQVQAWRVGWLPPTWARHPSRAEPRTEMRRRMVNKWPTMNVNSAIIVIADAHEPLVFQPETSATDDRSRQFLSPPRVFADKRTKIGGRAIRTHASRRSTSPLSTGAKPSLR